MRAVLMEWVKTADADQAAQSVVPHRCVSYSEAAGAGASVTPPFEL